MADLTMCTDKDCPLKDKCYRFNALVNEYRQAYFAEKVREWDKCDYFYDRQD